MECIRTGGYWLILTSILVNVNPALTAHQKIMAYLKGTHRLVVQITTPSRRLPLNFPEHRTLTNSQRILAAGQDSLGQYVKMELICSVPAIINIRSPYPTANFRLPDSVVGGLDSTVEVPTGHWILKKIIQSIQRRRPVYFQDEMVQALLSWTRLKIKFDSSLSINQTALQVLKRKTATCRGFVNLSLALLRTAGIPCRYMSCITPPNCGWGIQNRGGAHAFLEVYYPDVGWLGCDPQHSIHFVDPFHIVTGIGKSPDFWLPGDLTMSLPEDESALSFVPLTVYHDPYFLIANTRQDVHSPGEYLPFIFTHLRPDQSRCEVLSNGDQRVSYPDGRTEYLWVWGEKKITYPDGQFEFVAATSPFRPVRKVVRQLAPGETRIFYPDGHQEYQWRNGSRQVIVPNRGLVEFYPNGRLKRKVLNSGKQVHYWYFSQVEIQQFRAQNRTPAYKCIIYPDGQVQYEYVPL